MEDLVPQSEEGEQAGHKTDNDNHDNRIYSPEGDVGDDDTRPLHGDKSVINRGRGAACTAVMPRSGPKEAPQIGDPFELGIDHVVLEAAGTFHNHFPPVGTGGRPIRRCTPPAAVPAFFDRGVPRFGTPFAGRKGSKRGQRGLSRGRKWGRSPACSAR
jgi:hypothetical protein